MSNGVEAGLRHSARSWFAAHAKHLMVSIGLIVATAAIAQATFFQIDTDATWLAKNSAPGAGWNTAFAFDTAADGGWQAAQNNAVPPCGINGCMIWWDGQYFAAGQNHQFTARLTIDTATGVPAMPPSVSVLTGLLLLAFGVHRLRGRFA